MSDDEPDVPDFIDAIASSLKQAGIQYLEAKSMVEDMFAASWDQFPSLADIDPPTDAVH